MKKEKEFPVASPRRLKVWDGPSRRALIRSLAKNKAFEMVVRPVDLKDGIAAVKVRVLIYAARKRGPIEDRDKKQALMISGKYNEHADYGEKEFCNYFVDDEWMVEGVLSITEEKFSVVPEGNVFRRYRFSGYLNTKLRTGLIIEKEVINLLADAMRAIQNPPKLNLTGRPSDKKEKL